MVLFDFTEDDPFGQDDFLKADDYGETNYYLYTDGSGFTAWHPISSAFGSMFRDDFDSAVLNTVDMWNVGVRDDGGSYPLSGGILNLTGAGASSNGYIAVYSIDKTYTARQAGGKLVFECRATGTNPMSASFRDFGFCTSFDSWYFPAGTVFYFDLEYDNHTHINGGGANVDTWVAGTYKTYKIVLDVQAGLAKFYINGSQVGTQSFTQQDTQFYVFAFLGENTSSAQLNIAYMQWDIKE